MSFFEAFGAEVERIVASLSQNKKKKIMIYAEGVKAKLKQAEYCLEVFQKTSASANSSSTTSDSDSIYRYNDNIYFYTDAFFTFTYSTFDIWAQIANIKENLGLRERKVQLKSLTSTTCSLRPDAKDFINTLLRKYFFKQLEKYRHCSTHRRHIEIRSGRFTGRPGYTAQDEGYAWILCDNPESFNPSFSNRHVVFYCTEIIDNTKKNLLAAMKIL